MSRDTFSHVPLEEIAQLVEDAIDPVVLEAGRRRQEAIWLGRTPDYLPLLLARGPRYAGGLKLDRAQRHSEPELPGHVVPDELAGYPHYNEIEVYDDPEKMLYEVLWDMVGWARARSDTQLSVRNAFLTWALGSSFGQRIEFDESTPPWATDHLPKSRLDELQIDGMERRGLVPRSIEFIEYINAHLPPNVQQYIPDISGPLSLANYMFGNGWFWMDFLEDPAFIERALDLCTNAFKYMGGVYRQAVGHTGEFSPYCSMLVPGNAVKVVDDANVLLSPQQHGELVIPRIAECLEFFGGGWVHSCGHFPDKLDHYLELPHLNGINFGNPEMWDLDDAVSRIVRAGKVYCGAWARKPGEDMESYLRRAIKAAGPEKKGLIICLQETAEQPLPHPEETMEMWHRLQDEGAA